jgi:hypothetical protein
MRRGAAMAAGERRAAATGALKYQYEQLIKHLMLLQDHAAARTCPYTPAGEMCIRKHLLAIEAYAEETIPMEDNPTFKEKLANLQTEALNYRLDQEDVLCGEKEQALAGLDHWARKWRKEFEMHALTCELQKTAEESLAPVQA